MRRVVVTGIGLVTPLAWGARPPGRACWPASPAPGGSRPSTPTDSACQIACEVPRVDGRGGGGPDIAGSFNPDKVMSPKEQRRVDDFILYGMAAADEAVRDSGWTPRGRGRARAHRRA